VWAVLIGELAARAGVSTATVRFYERSGVLSPPPRSAGGYRDYPESAVADLGFVRAGQAIGLTLSELAEILAFRAGDLAPGDELIALMDRRLTEVESRLDQLGQVRAELSRLVALARRAELDDCAPATLYAMVTGDLS
jgi:DNA-binding transcriptional MerR regulator